MASTNKTTNYELSQFIETDRPAWLTDYNGDMRTIDSTMKAVSDVANGASGSISELADRMSTAEGNITTNTNDIATLDARADALEAGAQSQAGTIANIQTEQTAQNLGIEAATELGYNLARPYDSASTYAVGAYVLFQNTLYKCITAISTGEAFDPTKWIAIKATDEIAAGGYTLPTASASTLGGVKVGNNLTIDANGVLSASGGSSVIYRPYDSSNRLLNFTTTGAMLNGGETGFIIGDLKIINVGFTLNITKSSQRFFFEWLDNRFAITSTEEFKAFSIYKMGLNTGTANNDYTIQAELENNAGGTPNVNFLLGFPSGTTSRQIIINCVFVYI